MQIMVFLFFQMKEANLRGESRDDMIANNFSDFCISIPVPVYEQIERRTITGHLLHLLRTGHLNYKASLLILQSRTEFYIYLFTKYINQ